MSVMLSVVMSEMEEDCSFQKSSNSRISSKKKPENYFKKNTKFSKPKFSQMDSSVKKIGIGKNPNPISLPKTGISYPKKTV